MCNEDKYDLLKGYPCDRMTKKAIFECVACGKKITKFLNWTNEEIVKYRDFALACKSCNYDFRPMKIKEIH